MCAWVGGERACVCERNPCSKKSTKPCKGKVLTFFRNLMSKFFSFENDV